MPGPNNPPTAEQFAEDVEEVNEAGLTCVASFGGPGSCADLQAYKERLQDMIAAVNLVMADLNCGQ